MEVLSYLASNHIKNSPYTKSFNFPSIIHKMNSGIEEDAVSEKKLELQAGRNLGPGNEEEN